MHKFTYTKCFKESNLLLIAKELFQADFELHYHEFYELVIVTRGKGKHYTHNAEYEIIIGDIFVIPPNIPHGYKDGDGLKIINILFNPKMLETSAINIQQLKGFQSLFRFEYKYRDKWDFNTHLHINASDLHKISNLSHDMMKIYDKKSLSSEDNIITLGLFFQIMGLILQLYSKIEHPEIKELSSIAEVFNYMENNFEKNITLTKLAKLAIMTERTLTRHFLKMTGMSPIDYLLHLRIEKACEMLHNKKKYNITEIAFRIGFNDSNYFSRLFKKKIGISPSQYKQYQA